MLQFFPELLSSTEPLIKQNETDPMLTLSFDDISKSSQSIVSTMHSVWWVLFIWAAK